MSVVASHAEDWPRFRGPNGTGVGDIAALPAELGAGPNVVWKTTSPMPTADSARSASRYGNYDATAADKPGVFVVRAAVVRAADLTWFSGATQAQKDAAIAALEALKIVAR